ncbi:MAG: hypothetical protein ACI9GW_000286 [Halieaceae bacterium]|jgi:hypothetical protein
MMSKGQDSNKMKKETAFNRKGKESGKKNKES